MPGYLIAAILLGFPLLELFLLILVGGMIGGWVFALLLAGAVAGWLLIREESAGFVARLEAARGSRSSVVSAVAASGRNVIAGILLIIPGLISDVIALALLLWPARSTASRRRGGLEFGMASEQPYHHKQAQSVNRSSASEPTSGPAPAHDTLEGEYKRLD